MPLTLEQRLRDLISALGADIKSAWKKGDRLYSAQGMLTSPDGAMTTTGVGAGEAVPTYSPVSTAHRSEYPPGFSSLSAHVSVGTWSIDGINMEGMVHTFQYFYRTHQIFIRYNNGKMYTRHFLNGTPGAWGAWRVYLDEAEAFNHTGSSTFSGTTTTISGHLGRPAAIVTTDQLIQAGHYFVLVDASAGPVTITVDQGVAGRESVIMKIDSSANPVVVKPKVGQQLNGVVDGTRSITKQWYSITTIGYGSNYYIKDDTELSGKADKVGSADLEITDATKGLIIKSPNGTRWRLTVGDDGALTTTGL